MYSFSTKVEKLWKSEKKMKCTVGVSQERDLQKALGELFTAVHQGLDGLQPDLVILFASHHYKKIFSEFSNHIKDKTRARHILGAMVEAVIGDQEEFENQPALVLWAAKMPEVQINIFYMDYTEEEGFSGLPEWEEPFAQKYLLVLADPFTFPADSFLKQINKKCPGLSVTGGMAGGASYPRESQLLWNDQLFSSGALAISLEGNIQVTSVVSQGCRPFGKPMVITKAEKNIIFHLGGKPALERLQEVFLEMDSKDQKLLESGLHMGIAINPAQDSFDRGDFLVRSVIGLYQPAGAIMVTDLVRPGQTVQFHVRDASSASEDLSLLLKKIGKKKYRGALLFSCNGRGKHLFSENSHDIKKVHKYWADLPVGGFFAAGEIGPIGGENFLHGFTASIAFFSEKKE